MRALAYAALAIAAYALLLLPALALNHFDPSAFIVAGDQWVNAHATPGPILVRPNSGGYDGEFYYRLANHPFSFDTTAAGVQLDTPAWRMRRILYPLLALVAAAGSAKLIAYTLVALNLAGLGAIAALASRIAVKLALPNWTPLAVLAWPGFFVTLTHDTTEITAATFALAALVAYLNRHLIPYALLGACALFTRETTLLIFAGIAAYEFTQYRNDHARLKWAATSVLLMLPFLCWHVIVTVAWQSHPQPHQIPQHNLGLPFLGALQNLADCATGTRAWASTPTKNLIERAIVLFTATGLIAFCALTATSLRTSFNRPAAPIAAAWLAIAALMSLATADGPWVDPTAYARAFTECYVLGCFVIGASNRAPSRAITALTTAQFATIWIFTTIQFRPAT
jgi:hypothetical protein